MLNRLVWQQRREPDSMKNWFTWFRIVSLRRMVLGCVPSNRCHRMNCLAAGISILSFFVLVLNFNDSPAGLDTGRGKVNAAITRSVSSMSMKWQPTVTPVDSAILSEHNNAAASGGVEAPRGIVTVSANNETELRQRIHTAIHTGRLALEWHVAQLELGKMRLQQLPPYSCTFTKTERLDGSEEPGTPEVITLKVRQAPFSVYMKWIDGGDRGREILYVDGEHDGRMLVKLGGLKGKLLPAVKIEPAGSQALSEARHPVTELGLYHLSDLILKYRTRDLGLNSGVQWELIPDQKLDGRDCNCFITVYESSEIDPVYRKSVVYIDKELLVPVCVHNYTWANGDVDPTDVAAFDEATLIESYNYGDVQFNTQMADADFDRTNENYNLRR